MVQNFRIKKIIVSVLAFSMLSGGVTAFANIANYGIQQSGDKVIISGNLEAKDKNIELLVIPKERNFHDKLKESEITYIDQYNLSGDSTAFKFEIPFVGDPSAEYKVRLNGETFTQSVDFPLYYIAKSNFDDKLATMKSKMNDINDFKAFMSGYEPSLLLNNDIILGCNDFPATLNKSDICDVFFNSLNKLAPNSSKKVYEQIETIEDLTKLWNQSVIAQALSNDRITDIQSVAGYLDMSDANISKWYEHIVKENATKYLTNILKQKTYPTGDLVSDELKKAIVLTVVKYPNGNENIGRVLKDFSSVTKIFVNDEYSKYQKLAGKSFVSFDDFLVEYNSISNNNPGVSGGGGGGAGGLGGALPTMDGLLTSIYPQDGSMAQEINLKFVDLHTVPWAYEAISALFDRGIINGKSETRFMPEDSITREEMAKLLVCVLDLQDEPYVNHFDDVNESDWFCKYVNIAYKHGICKGYGNGLFGVGAPITRQDMAVMIYNAMVKKGFVADTTRPTFDDNSSIANYAMDAVSALVNQGSVNGTTDNKFAPLGNANRASAAKVLYGVLDILA